MNPGTETAGRLGDLEALGDVFLGRSEWPVASIMSRAVLTCGPDVPLDEAAAMMGRRGCSCIVIVSDNGAPVGIWTERDALAVDLDTVNGMVQPISTAMSQPIRTILPQTSLQDLVTRFRESDVRHFVVAEDGVVQGVVTQTDVIRHQGLHSFLTLRDIGSLVRRTATVVMSDEVVSNVARTMRNSGVDAVVVSDNGAPYGVLTERDVLRLIAHRQTATRVRDVCSHPVVSAPRTLPLIQAHDLMERRRIRHLVVVDEDGAAVSMLSFSDILSGIELDYLRFLRGALDRQQAALAATEARERTIIETTQEGYVEIDRDGLIVRVNAAMQRLVGLSAEKMIGQSPLDLCDPGRADFYRQQLDRVATTDHRSYEANYIHRDGHLVPLKVSASTLRDADGKATGAFAFMTDLSDIKKAEARLSEMVEKVSRSNGELETFAYAVSHDLQEPLRMITSYLTLLDRRYGTAIDAEGAEFISYAVEGAKRMQSMITDLLEYSRLDRMGSPFDACDLNAVLTAVTRNLHGGVQESGADVRLDALPTIVADRRQMEHLFQNMIGNALKYRSADRPAVISVAAARSPAQGMWRFTISDNGIGISSEHRAQVFDVFRQLHPRGAYGGNGIGLAICKRIVERHGGTITIDSDVAQGACFHIDLPDAPQQDPS